MEYRQLGKSGLKVSELSLGSWLTFGFTVDTKLAEKMMGTAFDAGVNFFDNAEGYAHGESEIVMGDALKNLKLPRDCFIVSSKVYWGGHAPTQLGLCRKHMMDACHAALKRLQVDYLDLYFCHRPDQDTPVEEVVWTMHNLVQQGKVMYWGTSMWSAEDIRQANVFARENHLIPPTMEQPEYSMLIRDKVEEEFTELYDEFGLGTTTFSPLRCGVLTGKYNDGIPEGSRAASKDREWLVEYIGSAEGQEHIDKAKQLTKVADKLDCTLAKLAIAWCLLNPNVSTVILGASGEEQLVENLKSPTIVPKLDAGIISEIDSILK